MDERLNQVSPTTYIVSELEWDLVLNTILKFVPDCTDPNVIDLTKPD